MKFSELIQISKIDFTKAIIQVDTGTRLSCDFEVSPQEYINFSKIDFRKKDKHGKINALTNAKRAIDCQIDRILKSLGYEFEDFPKYLDDFSTFFCETEEEKSLPMKLKIIVAFGMAPCRLISDIRNLRNKIEHDYIVPNEQEVKNSIEIAELFCNATEKKLMDYWEFGITDRKHKKRNISGIYILRNEEENKFELHYIEKQNNNRFVVEISKNDPEYAPMMRMHLFTDQEEELLKSLKYLLRIIDHKIPEDKINITIEE